MSDGRRERKSKAALQNALTKLMAQKRVQNISITELCALADVNRSTFYAHYGSVEQLLCDTHEALFADMDRFLGLSGSTSSHPPSRTDSQILTEVLNYMRTDPFLFFLTNDDSHLLEQNMSSHYMKKLCPPDSSLERRYTLLYHTLGCFSLLRQWIADGCPCPSNRLAELLVSLSDSGQAQ